jgi:V/A-type H+-transporting ATPase subunit D
MRLAVSANRMQLLRLRKRLAIARRGHKLLKDKQEEMMRIILGLIAEVREERHKVESGMARILGRFAIARASYGSEALDEAVMLPSKQVSVNVTLLVLAEKEKSLELLADEMLRTRRRVNALEFVLIPNLMETVKFINLKLAEAERSDQTRLMRVKEIIRGEAR